MFTVCSSVSPCPWCSFVPMLGTQTLLMEWRSILSGIGVPYRQDVSLHQYLSTAKQRLEWQVRI